MCCRQLDAWGRQGDSRRSQRYLRPGGGVADSRATADLYGNAPSYSCANGGSVPDPNRAADTYGDAHRHAVTYADSFGGKCGGTWDGVRYRDHAESLRPSATPPGEWFEVFNSRSDAAVDINGWTIRDQGSNLHVVDNGGPLLIPPLTFLVLGRNADPAANGGVAVDYRYSGFTLGNTADEIELVDVLGTVVDTVSYTSSIVFNGASSGLAPSAFNPSANDILANWCAAASLMPGGDKGTPGAANDTCALAGASPTPAPPPTSTATPLPTPVPTAVPSPTPTAPPTPTATPTVMPPPTPIVSVVSVVAPGTVFVTEIMPNPAAVSDTAGEWFEVFNSRSDAAVDINGWTIRDQGSNLHLVDSGGPLLIPPLTFLVLGRNADPAANGGVAVDYQYSGFTLGNTADEIELVDPAGTVVDVLVYPSSLVFTGSSASLNVAAFDASANDQVSSWCASTSGMPGGDKGTPGEVNDPCP